PPWPAQPYWCSRPPRPSQAAWTRCRHRPAPRALARRAPASALEATRAIPTLRAAPAPAPTRSPRDRGSGMSVVITAARWAASNLQSEWRARSSGAAARRLSAARLVNGAHPIPSQRLSRIDQDERDAARLAAAVDPGVVGALLDEHVARPEMDLLLVEFHVDLARHHHRVVDGARAVHERMGGRPILRRRVVVVVRHLPLHEIGLKLGDLRV